MVSKFIVNNVDLDTVFAPYHSGWPQSQLTHFNVNTTDLNARYAALASGTAAGTSHFINNTTDLSSLFAAINTTNVQVATQPSNVSGSIAAGSPSGTVTSNTTSVAGTKGGGTYTYTWNLASGSAAFTNPSSSSTAVTATVNASSTLSGTMYCTISDGVTSVNTNTVSWSLQNTSASVQQLTANFTAEKTLSNGSWDNNIGYAAGFFTYSGGTLGTTSGFLSNAAPQQLLGGTGGSIVSIGPIGSDPGQNSLISVTINGVTLYGNAATYTYVPPASGRPDYGSWSWPTSFAMIQGQQYTASISASSTAPW
jgi:hypothetical protein